MTLTGACKDSPAVWLAVLILTDIAGAASGGHLFAQPVKLAVEKFAHTYEMTVD